MTTCLEPGPLRIIARISMPTLPVGTSRHARKTRARARIAYLRPKRMRSSSHMRSPDLLIITVCPWLNRTGRTIHYRTAGADLERP